MIKNGGERLASRRDDVTQKATADTQQKYKFETFRGWTLKPNREARKSVKNFFVKANVPPFQVGNELVILLLILIF